MRILHTADWQIGKGFGRIPGDSGAALRNQRLETVAQLARMATDYAVDAVLVAGDVFDSQTISDRTLRQTFEQLRHFEGPWVLLPGNHDAAVSESVWTRARRMGAIPDNVFCALTPEPILFSDTGLAVLPAPLQRRHEHGDLTVWFDTVELADGYIRVGLAHGSVTDFLPGEAEQHNPIERTRAETAGLAYLALGDWHGTLAVNHRTWYAGTPETDSFRSSRPGHALLVTLPDGEGEPNVEVLPTSHYQWHRLEQTLQSAADLDVLADRLTHLGEPYERHVVELVLSGTLALADKEAADRLIQAWDARLQYLRVDDAALWPAATEADLAVFQDAGFVGQAAQILQNRRQAGEEAAGTALQRLFAAYRQAKGE